MKKLPLKWKLTLFYTLFMMLLTGLMLGLLFSLSNSQILATVKREMQEQVFDAYEDVEMEDGSLEIDSDFYEVEDGIYRSVYDESGNLLGGRLPYEFTQEIPLKEGLQELLADGVKWYVMDASFYVEGYGRVFVRGITSITKAESSLMIILRLSVILFPLMVLLTAALGYFFISRALRPVSQITQTAEEIYEKEDLSKRIGLSQGKDEIHKLAATFDKMLEKLQTSFEREKQFTSDASHELRTPVTVILSQCEYLLEDSNLSKEERESVEVIQKKAQNMARMISQLLFLSRADQNRQAVQKEKLNLSMLTEIAAEEQEEIAAKKGIRIETKLQEDIEAYVDETLFIRLWMNLIGNAIAYGRENGWILVSLYQKEDAIIGSVEDNGIGMEEEQLPRIWERFYQADSSRREIENASCGLGLPMVKWIVEAHQGFIKVESQKGVGSRFTFTLPKNLKADPET